MIKLLLNFIFLFSVSSIFYKSSIDSERANSIESEKTQALMYWFDANSAQYIGHMETTGCDNSGHCPCAYGYATVANPNSPQKPNTAPQETEYSLCY